MVENGEGMIIMRNLSKYFAVLIAGALMAFSGQALADSVSKVGKRVQAEYEVVVDGKTLEAKAWAIDGQTNSPNRALGNALGYDVQFKDNQVVWTKKEGAKVPEVPIEEQVTPSPESKEPQYTLESITKLIESRESALRPVRVIIDASVAEGASEEELIEVRKALKEKEDELNELKAIKAELESQK